MQTAHPIRPRLWTALTGLVCAGTMSAAEIDPLPWVPGSTTRAVLPDTECYTTRYPQYFEAQTQWIADQSQTRNIAYTIHLGDITQDNAPHRDSSKLTRYFPLDMRM